MTSISQLGTTLKTFLTEDAGRLAQQHGLRRRLLSGAVLAQLFVLGWLQQPTAGRSRVSALCRHVGTAPQEADARCAFYAADSGLAPGLVAAGGTLRGVRPSRFIAAAAALSGGAGGRWQSDHVTSRSARALAGLWWDRDRPCGYQDESRHETDRALGCAGRSDGWSVCPSRASA